MKPIYLLIIERKKNVRCFMRKGVLKHVDLSMKFKQTTNKSFFWLVTPRV